MDNQAHERPDEHDDSAAQEPAPGGLFADLEGDPPEIVERSSAAGAPESPERPSQPVAAESVAPVQPETTPPVAIPQHPAPPHSPSPPTLHQGFEAQSPPPQSVQPQAGESQPVLGRTPPPRADQLGGSQQPGATGPTVVRHSGSQPPQSVGPRKPSPADGHQPVVETPAQTGPPPTTTPVRPQPAAPVAPDSAQGGAPSVPGGPVGPIPQQPARPTTGRPRLPSGAPVAGPGNRPVQTPQHGATRPTSVGSARPQPVPQQGAGGPRAARPILVRRPGGPSALVKAEEKEEQKEELTEKAIRAAPPWLISCLFHMVLLMILGLVFLPQLGRRQIELETVWAEKLGDQLEFDSFLAGTSQDQVEEPILTPDNLPEVPDPFAAPPKVEMIVPNGTTSTSDIPSTQIGLALMGREEGMKRALLAAYGGTGATEAAVQLGLEWLARNQKKQGQWSLVGPYSDGAIEENETAATAMALLAFQGAGITHRRGRFKENVARGWQWLLEEQDADGCFYHEGPFNHRFYTQAQCTIALCELYGMTKDEKFKEPAERAVQYLLKSQSSEGGWRYSPQSDSDLSVTGWVVMALQSARMAYLAVPEDTFRRIERFLDRVAHEGGSRYCYQRGYEPSATMTAEGLLCRQYLGWPRNDDRLIAGVEYITRKSNLINYDKPNVYYWYYATQVCHHMEGEYWKRWNEVMRQEVPEHQVKVGREKGSWDPMKPRRDEWADHGGRLYVTCLSIYMLEVYYRHLPLYTNVYHLLGTGR